MVMCLGMCNGFSLHTRVTTFTVMNGALILVPRQAMLERAADPNTGMPKRVHDDGIDAVEDAPRNSFGTGGRTAKEGTYV